MTEIQLMKYLESHPYFFRDEIKIKSPYLTTPQSFLEGVKPLDRRNYSFNVVKVTSADSDFALLIDPLGYSYPRYIAIEQ